MKKLILVLAILVAVPAFAALDVNLVKVGSQVQIRYTGADPCNLPRGLALAIEVNSTADVCGISGYKVGESNSTSRGFGIYPARITFPLDTNLPPSDWGNPLALDGDPGAGDQTLPSKNLVLEFGSLYAPVHDSVNSPAVDGTLCTLSVECNSAPSFTMKMTDEDIYRGGVVLENGTTVDVNKTLVYTCAAPIPGKATNPDPANDVTGVVPSKVLGWAAGTDANSHRVYFGRVNPPISFKVELPLATTTYDPPTTEMNEVNQSQAYYWRIDEKNDSGTTTGDVWKFTVQECFKDPNTTKYNAWVAWSKPNCWCYRRNCRGDINGLRQGLYWVSAQDLTLFKAAFNKSDSSLTLVSNGICADNNRSKQGLYRVSAQDLVQFKLYLNKSEASVPVCDSNIVNFWSN
jgi:hypothetical protein